MKRKLGLLIFVGAVLCSFGTLSAADDFYVVGSGGKPLGKPITSLPATITDSGMYYVTHNLTTSSAGIVVDADNVTLDLMGFTLTGPGKTANSFHGIEVKSGRFGVEVRNGCLTTFGGDGIHCAGTNCRFLGLRVLNVGAAGISVSLKNQVTSCFASGCGHEGIYASGQSMIKGNTVTGNAYDGISAEEYSIITGNSAQNNTQNGISTWYGSTVQGNVVNENGAIGIGTQDNCTVAGNTSSNNGGAAISAGSISTVIDNTVQSNIATTLATGDSCTISRNTVRYQGSLFKAIVTGNNCLLTNNNAWGGVAIGAGSIQVDNNFH